MDFDPLLLIAPLLVFAAYWDLRFLRIPDIISVAVVTAFVFCALLSAPDDLMTRLLVTMVVFGIGVLAFAFRLVGGGDVKLFSALVLFIPADRLILFANVFSVSLLIGIGGIVALRRSRFAGVVQWKSLSEPRAFPMAVSIAFAGLTYPVLASFV